jgi:hypothetical protein
MVKSGWIGLALGLWLSGCREDCSEPAKMGDFEFSQGNYANAIRHYERALTIESPCGAVKAKLEDAKKRAITAP